MDSLVSISVPLDILNTLRFWYRQSTLIQLSSQDMTIITNVRIAQVSFYCVSFVKRYQGILS